ncbi:hypothetical protein [Longimicrobium sp.]|uniref:hypothetical protein n=1 Tax=Longimicrobium sp. TaxID=2029185 RepID=UPI003B3B4B7B
MTDRIQNLVDAGRLSRDAAADDEIVGLWTNALQAADDAQVESVSANGRLLRAYDAGRIAAAAVVRSRDLRVRAANHHKLTLAVAALVSGPELALAFSEMDGMRRLRADLETAGRPARPTPTCSARWMWCGAFFVRVRSSWRPAVPSRAPVFRRNDAALR